MLITSLPHLSAAQVLKWQEERGIRVRERLNELEERLKRLQMLNKKLTQLKTTTEAASSVMPEMWNDDPEGAGAYTYPPPAERQISYGAAAGASMSPNALRRSWANGGEGNGQWARGQRPMMIMMEGEAGAAGGGQPMYDSMVFETPHMTRRASRGPLGSAVQLSPDNRSPSEERQASAFPAVDDSRRPATYNRPVTPG